MKFTVKAEGVEASLKRLSPEAAQDCLFRALGYAQDVVCDEAKALASRHDKTGAMSKSLRMHGLAKGAKQAVITIGGPGAPYAPYVHEGTRPHVIRPKNKKTLRWQTADGQTFARSVKHPGYKGDPFMTNAWQNKRAYVMQIFRDAFREALS